jgi:hypothetical protein
LPAEHEHRGGSHRADGSDPILQPEAERLRQIAFGVANESGPIVVVAAAGAGTIHDIAKRRPCRVLEQRQELARASDQCL